MVRQTFTTRGMEYKPKNFLHKKTEHVNEIALDGIYHNNRMESFDGNTLRYRESTTRGIKDDDTSIMSGLQVYHNYIRPHLGLPYGQTPAEAAGIHVEGTDKWKTLIQAAAKANRE